LKPAFAEEPQKHIPVLLSEVLSFLLPEKGGLFIDATLGLGGHAKSFLLASPEVRICAFEQDPNALEIAKKNLSSFGERVVYYPENFSHLGERLSGKNIRGIFFDIGVSSLQIDTPKRGFSFRNEGPLDMRMNPQDHLTARDLLMNESEESLSRIFWEYGEEPCSRRIAKEIVVARKIKSFSTTTELAEFIAKKKPFSKLRKMGGGHPAAQIFQALRIAVNKELEVLSLALSDAFSLLGEGGKIAVISFHSLEDSIVKNFFRSHSLKEKHNKYSSSANTAPFLSILTKKPIMASEEEMLINPRARSARLRIAEKHLSPLS
jgi:16S rRNA (cytosine1402-N4)-methyltransferase